MADAASTFEHLRTQHIDALNLELQEYRHRKTGAIHCHLQADNPENVFMVALRTVPTDSTGVAHILEHSVLCGSERYPVRDPFFLMLRRSLNTFMNAMTSSDWTAYPFASQNKKDFNNLLSVYCDAVFFSRLDPLDFAQEGHRVEFKTPTDANADLQYKGVVYNEMKGAMSSPTSVLWQTLTQHLYPTTTYHYNSGGDPADIPNLSYDGLMQFYKKHYHPSNATFLTYGDIPAAEHQAQFEKLVLSKVDPAALEIKISNEKRFTQPQQITVPYAFDDQDTKRKTHHVLGWLLGESTNHRELFHMHLLSHVLLDNSASPLLKALETTNLGTAPSPLCGLEESNREMCFVCGIEGSDPENADALEALVFDVLKDVAENGVPKAHIEAVLHQFELSQKEVGGGHYPYGLQLMFAALPAYIHGGDPLPLLDIDPILKDLRKSIEDPNFIKTLIKTHLLENPHRVRLSLVPDATLSQQQKRKEQEKLKAIKDAMDPTAIEKVITQAQQLQARQTQEEDLSILPKVGLDDIPSDIKTAKGITSEINSAPLHTYAQGTNGLAYQDIIFDLPNLPEPLLQILPYYSFCLNELGVGDKTYLETQAWQSRVSGGIAGSSALHSQLNDEQQVQGRFVISGKALSRNHAPLTELLYETIHNLRFDEHDRIKEMIAQATARWEQAVTGHGHQLAMTIASAGMSPLSALSHRLEGMGGIAQIKALNKSLSDKHTLADLADRMQQLHQTIINAPKQFLSIGEQAHLAGYTQDLQNAWTQATTAETISPFTLDGIRQPVKEVWTTNTRVNFCAKAYPTVPGEHPDAAPLQVLAPFLTKRLFTSRHPRTRRRLRWRGKSRFRHRRLPLLFLPRPTLTGHPG